MAWRRLAGWLAAAACDAPRARLLLRRTLPATRPWLYSCTAVQLYGPSTSQLTAGPYPYAFATCTMY